MTHDPAQQEDPKAQLVKRKLEGVEIPLNKQVQAKTATTFLEYVHLVHNALPELNLDEIDTSVTFLKHKFSAPVLIDAMTGGAAPLGKINGNLAIAAEQLSLGMVVGSQRAGLLSDEAADSYAVARRNAPNAFLAANIGGAQLAKGFPLEAARKLVDMIKADALVVHLNPLQELIQPEGEPLYKGVVGRISEFAEKIGVPIIVKEVGAGLSREAALRAEMAGASAVNVSGLGGTSWAGVEQIRAEEREVTDKASLGELFWDWGIPTAAALLEVTKAVRIPVLGSGGLRNGLDIAKCIALGATIGGMAWPMLKRAVISPEVLVEYVKALIGEIRGTMFLVGSRNVEELKRAGYVLTGPLADWRQQRTP
ncbi:MAG: type 2 isopentenyl-diphosphate Delta-isomerase [Thaumarchaeota archaeon]|nr:type 2 isopentenyl-diphosphate Delta-isomerase [Nitrososphaerota archaeon]